MIGPAEQILLAALTAEYRDTRDSPLMAVEHGVAGGILLELCRRGRILIADEEARPIEARPTGDEVLDDALRRLAAGGGEGATKDWIDIIAGDAPSWRPALVKRLVSGGLVAVEDKALVWGFRQRRYRPSRDGPRLDAGAGTPDPAVATLAGLCGLSGSDLSSDVAAPSEIAVIAATRQAYAGQNEAGSSSASKPGRISKSGSWEWRAFWPGETVVVESIGGAGAAAISDYKHGRVKDRYLLIGKWADNIKLRKNGLQVKRLLERYNGAEAYLPKKSFKFPIAVSKLARIFPRLRGLGGEVGGSYELDALLAHAHYQPSWIDVAKERYRLRMNHRVRVELSTLSIADESFLSACVEGPDHHHVLAQAGKFSGPRASVAGFTQFLRTREPRP